ncbi:integrase core domain-containing protein [Streptomyces sp. NPDC002476]|uniref:integrase core domain-containing protein n=1 Tax=Streptomyces sp. NPDC002476 TaxID=3364648 RepID=UPI003686210B
MPLTHITGEDTPGDSGGAPTPPDASKTPRAACPSPWPPAGGTNALRAAARTRGSLAAAVFRNDHLAQHISRQFTSACAELGVRQSMGAVGTSADNALAESFNATLKHETLRGTRRFDGAHACRLEVFRWTTRTTPAHATRRTDSRRQSPTNSSQPPWHLPHNNTNGCPPSGGKARAGQTSGYRLPTTATALTTQGAKPQKITSETDGGSRLSSPWPHDTRTRLHYHGWPVIPMNRTVRCRCEEFAP